MLTEHVPDHATHVEVHAAMPRSEDIAILPRTPSCRRSRTARGKETVRTDSSLSEGVDGVQVSRPAAKEREFAIDAGLQPIGRAPSATAASSGRSRAREGGEALAPARGSSAERGGDVVEAKYRTRMRAFYGPRVHPGAE
jgi:hypothetical protein